MYAQLNRLSQHDCAKFPVLGTKGVVRLLCAWRQVADRCAAMIRKQKSTCPHFDLKP